MFCSKCGKTLFADEERCGHCGAPIGESKFLGVPYTSAQAMIEPGKFAYGGRRGYTRAVYADIDESAGSADERTVYRPSQEDTSIPEDVRRDMRAFSGVNPPESVVQTVDRFEEEGLEEIRQELPEDDFDISNIRSRPIHSRGQSGISPDVTEFMQRMEAGQGRKGGRLLSRSQTAQDGGQAAPEDDVFSDRLEEEPEDAFEERPGLGGRLGQLLKILAALVAVAAIAVGVAFWVRHVRENSKGAPIDGVTLSLYDAGIKKIKAHADSNYVKSLLDKYTTDGILTLTNQLEADAGELDTLMPAEPSINDPLFVESLKSIQTNIGNAVTMDALALAQPTTDSQTASDARWAVISNALTALEQATTAQELSAIVNGEKITIQTAAPTPSPTPIAYNALTRGDKSEEVRQMQERLWQLGFLQDDRDGAFGGNTYTAVKAFQQAAGLDVTGIADSRTLALLYSDEAPSTRLAQPTPNASQDGAEDLQNDSAVTDEPADTAEDASTAEDTGETGETGETDTGAEEEGAAA